jgi:hypothetical protein
VFAARYELNSYIVFRKRLVSRRLMSAVMEGPRGAIRGAQVKVGPKSPITQAPILDFASALKTSEKHGKKEQVSGCSCIVGGCCIVTKAR